MEIKVGQWYRIRGDFNHVDLCVQETKTQFIMHMYDNPKDLSNRTKWTIYKDHIDKYSIIELKGLNTPLYKLLEG